MENGRVINNNTDTAEELSKFYKTSVGSPNIQEDQYIMANVKNIDPAAKAIK